MKKLFLLVVAMASCSLCLAQPNNNGYRANNNKGSRTSKGGAQKRKRCDWCTTCNMQASKCDCPKKDCKPCGPKKVCTTEKRIVYKPEEQLITTCTSTSTSTKKRALKDCKPCGTRCSDNACPVSRTTRESARPARSKTYESARSVGSNY
jgi:hypothetical protein